MFVRTLVISKIKNHPFPQFQLSIFDRARLGGQVSVYELSDEESEEKFKLLHNFELPVDAQDKPVALLRVEILDSILVAFESSKVFNTH